MLSTSSCFSSYAPFLKHIFVTFSLFNSSSLYNSDNLTVAPASNANNAFSCFVSASNSLFNCDFFDVIVVDVSFKTFFNISISSHSMEEIFSSLQYLFKSANISSKSAIASVVSPSNRKCPLFFKIW